MLDAGANIDVIDDCGMTALMGCSDCLMAEMLLEEGANIDFEDVYDYTPLIHAGRSGLWNAAYLMLKLQYHEDN